MAQTPLQTQWQDYFFLTCEMAKFLAKNDMDMFYTLMGQRASIQAQIKRAAPSEPAYHASPAGQELLRRIQRSEQELHRQLCQKFNMTKQQRQINQAYDGVTPYAGRYINRHT